MLILHDPDTLVHKTVELLGARLVPALESPERILSIVSAVQVAGIHDLQTISFNPGSESAATLFQLLSATHDAGYLDHLEHAHAQWVKKGLIKQDENILPECFVFPNSAHKGEPPAPPKDIFARPGFYAFDMSTGICADTYKSAIASVNLAYQGVQTLVEQSTTFNSQNTISTLMSQTTLSDTKSPHDLLVKDSLATLKLLHSTVLALCRPPGHHCDTRRAGGYCYLNNAVVAVEAIRFHASQSPRSPFPSLSIPLSPHSAPNITILDLDFHHGNGTQEAFYSDPTVQYISIHGEDEYPYYTGSASETGAPGSETHVHAPIPPAGSRAGTANILNTNLNLPIPTKSSLDTYLARLDEALAAIPPFNPSFLILSLGFDTFHLDPLGGFDIRTEDYAEIAGRVKQTVKEIEQRKKKAIPSLILLEGGYVIDRLGENLLSFLKGWEVGGV